MILNDVVFVLRKIKRNTFINAVNVVGLSVGLSACLIILLIVIHESSFDQFQPDRNRIFRMYSTFPSPSSSLTSGVPTAFGDFVKENLKGIESVVLFYTLVTDVDLSNPAGSSKHLGNNSKVILTAPEYFEVFNYYEWIAGNPKDKDALNKPFQVVLTKSQARKYFGEVDLSTILGKEIHYLDSLVVTVSGVVEDIEKNTDLDFTDFVSVKTIESCWLKDLIKPNSWQNVNSSVQLFIKLAEASSINEFQSQLPVIQKAYKEHNNKGEFELIPRMQGLDDLHFNSDLGIFNHSGPAAKLSTLKILLIVAVLLLTIAVINFVNLETSQFLRYKKEVGLRKLFGSSRYKLIRRFLFQTFLLCFVAELISLYLTSLYFSQLNFFTPIGFEFSLSDHLTLVITFSSLVIITFLAGIYPAFVLTSYSPGSALRGSGFLKISSIKSQKFRSGMTIFQLGFSQIMIVGTLVVIMQLNYVMDKDLGFSPHAIVMVRSPIANPSRIETFKNELLQFTEISNVTVCGNPPLSTGFSTMLFNFDNGKEIIELEAYSKFGDSSYLAVFGIQLIAGRNCTQNDSVPEFLVNETFLNSVDLERADDAIGKSLGVGNIVGVVRDFHSQPLWNEIKPTVITYRRGPNIGIKISTRERGLANLKDALQQIEGSYRKNFQDDQFDYYFLSDQINQIYANEQRFKKLVGMSTIIAILISSFGLFGYFSFNVAQRTKEISIRKVLGATSESIMILLCREFLKLVVIAFIISAPIAHYATNSWLEKFPYRINDTVAIFLITASLSVVLCLITIGGRALRAANINPVVSLKLE